MAKKKKRFLILNKKAWNAKRAAIKWKQKQKFYKKCGKWGVCLYGCLENVPKTQKKYKKIQINENKT